jgi:NAD(P)-dependent dehydrogenase (short-subunit alcohol dehydrogenase family)
MVSSELHKYCGSFDLENLNSEKTWKPFFVYNRTKLANILFTRELNRRLREVGRSPTELTVNALHPGAVRTALFRNANEIWYMFVFSSFAKLFYKVRQDRKLPSFDLSIRSTIFCGMA